MTNQNHAQGLPKIPQAEHHVQTRHDEVRNNDQFSVHETGAREQSMRILRNVKHSYVRHQQQQRAGMSLHVHASFSLIRRRQ